MPTVLPARAVKATNVVPSAVAKRSVAQIDPAIQQVLSSHAEAIDAILTYLNATFGK